MAEVASIDSLDDWQDLNAFHPLLMMKAVQNLSVDSHTRKSLKVKIR